MSQGEAGKFRCEVCGRRFTWRPEIAGREAKCPCGSTVICPECQPGVEDDLYDLAPSEAIPEPQTKKPAVTRAVPTPALPVIPMANPVDAASVAQAHVAPVGGRTLAYATPKLDNSDPAEVIQLQAPLWILAGGVCVEVAAAYFQSGGSRSFVGQVLLLGLGLFITTPLMLVAVMITAKFRGIKLGAFWPAIIKLAAISIGPGAAVDLLRPILMFIPFGGLGGLLLEFVLFFALLGLFFDLDESDTWYCLCVMFIVNVSVYLTLKFM